MRNYFYISGDTKALNSLPGCCYVENAGRGHGAELWFDAAAMPEGYPDKVALVCELGMGLLQVVPLVDDGGALLKLVQDGAAKAGLTVFPDAKSFAASQPLTAEAHLYEQRAKAGGGTERKTGAPLQVACRLAGDDPVACADPGKVAAAEPLKEGP